MQAVIFAKLTWLGAAIQQVSEPTSLGKKGMHIQPMMLYLPG